MNNPDQSSLSGQVAVVTGAGRGIGAGIARKLASMGASVVLCGRSLGPLQSTAMAISAASGRAEAVQCDVSNDGSVAQFFDRVGAELGPVDILVNNAGIARDTHVIMLDAANWDAVPNSVPMRSAYLAA